MAKIVVLKGGKGSGHKGHRGIPGVQGGSLPDDEAPQNYAVSSYDIITGNPADQISEKDLHILDDSITHVNKIVPSMNTSKLHFAIVPVIMGDVVGACTKYRNGPLKGQQIIAICPSKITKALEIHGNALKSWNDIQEDLTYESYMRHTIIHELGHRYWEDNNIESSWTFGYNFNGVSGYGSYYKDVKESFADAFAGFVLGYDMDSEVEKWFMENVE